MGQRVQRWSNRFHRRDKLLMLRTDVIEGEEGVREAKAVTHREHEDTEQEDTANFVWFQQLKTNTLCCQHPKAH